MNLGEKFDLYSLAARVRPAFLTLFPLLLTIAVWTPALYTAAAGLFSLPLACGVIAWFAHLARARGRAAELRLFTEWGGKPTTIWLRHRDDHLDVTTKARYFSFLEKHIPSWKAPSKAQEQKDPMAADGRYNSAVIWLLEHTRNPKAFPFVFKENVSYGFRRNLYGLKPIGIAVTGVGIAMNSWALYISFYAGRPYGLPRLASFLVTLAALAAWVFVVRPEWIRDAADAYARTLLSCCESSVGTAPQSPQLQAKP